MPLSRSTCGSSCCFDSSSTWPIVGEVARNGFSPLARKIERVLQRDPAVEDRLRVDQRRADAGGTDLEDDVRLGFGAGTPACRRRHGRARCRRSPGRRRASGCRKTSLAPARNAARRRSGRWLERARRAAPAEPAAREPLRAPAAAPSASPETVAPAETGERGWAPAVAGPLGAGSPARGAGADARADRRVDVRLRAPGRAWRRRRAARRCRCCRTRRAAPGSGRARATAPICTTWPSCTAITGRAGLRVDASCPTSVRGAREPARGHGREAVAEVRGGVNREARLGQPGDRAEQFARACRRAAARAASPSRRRPVSGCRRRPRRGCSRRRPRRAGSGRRRRSRRPGCTGPCSRRRWRPRRTAPTSTGRNCIQPSAPALETLRSRP